MALEQTMGEWAGTLFSSQFCYEIKNATKLNFIHLEKVHTHLGFC